jgi:non-homologous end joining protein Ku
MLDIWNPALASFSLGLSPISVITESHADQYLLEKKKNGMHIAKAAAPSKGNVINLMEALKASIKTAGKSEPTAVAKPSKPAKKTAKPKRKAG